MKQKRIRRITPCPSYDVEKIESWLSDMANEGWILEKDGEIFGWLAFVKEAPQNLRYRLEPKKDGTGFGDVPDMEIQELCREYGWEYTDSYGNFFIYRSIHPDVREMNTDLQVQAAALKAAKKNSTVTLVLDAILLSNIFSSFLQMPCWSLVHMGLAYHLAHLIALIWISAEGLLHWLHLRRLHRQLQANIPLNHSKPWKRGAPFHLFSKFAYIIVLFLLFGVILGSCTRSMGLDYTETADYPGDPPFATASDILPEGSFTRERFLQNYNAYTVNSSFFAPQIIEWKEYGVITTPDAQRFEGVLNVTYYETKWPWLAQGLMEDLYRDAQEQTYFSSRPSPDLAADDIICYNRIYPSVLIRQGNIVVEANVGLEYHDQDLLEDWIQRMAEMLVRE